MGKSPTEFTTLQVANMLFTEQGKIAGRYVLQMPE
jgi:hypothetical protein